MIEIINSPSQDLIITSDESWFYYENYHDAMWARSADEVKPRPKRTIGARKCMLTVFWGLQGFHLVDILPHGMTFNCAYVSTLITRLDKNLHETGQENGLAGVILHWDNARPHVAGTTKTLLTNLQATTMPHPPYSPDLAPCDFFLFGHVKRQLQGSNFEDTPSLITRINEILSAITPEMRKSVFANWITRLNWVIENNGDYYNNNKTHGK